MDLRVGVVAVVAAAARRGAADFPIVIDTEYELAGRALLRGERQTPGVPSGPTDPTGPARPVGPAGPTDPPDPWFQLMASSFARQSLS